MRVTLWAESPRFFDECGHRGEYFGGGLIADFSAQCCEYFVMSRAARNSYEAVNARARGAAFSLYAALVDTLRLPQFVEWLDRKLTRKAQR